jgi:hypothetical protein
MALGACPCGNRDIGVLDDMPVGMAAGPLHLGGFHLDGEDGLQFSTFSWDFQLNSK